MVEVKIIVFVCFICSKYHTVPKVIIINYLGVFKGLKLHTYIYTHTNYFLSFDQTKTIDNKNVLDQKCLHTG